MDKWDRRFIQMAKEVSSWSKDPGTKVGAVIVDQNKRIISTGYNGLPKGIADTHDRLHRREIKLSMTIHAEENALLFAKCDLTNMILYVTMPPCSHCACKIIQSGIKKVVSYKNKNPKWEESIQLSRELFNEANIEFIEIEEIENKI